MPNSVPAARQALTDELGVASVDELLDQMRRGGVQKVLLLTQQKTE